MSALGKVTDQVVRESIVDPVGGVGRFRLVACPGFKLIQYSDEEGEFLDLIIEDDELARATISYLERHGVPEIARGSG
jgi:hypothetical protein